MLVTNTTSNFYYLGSASYPLPPQGSVTVPNSAYDNDDTLAKQINYLDETGAVTVSSEPAGYPRQVGASEGGSFSGDASDVTFTPAGSIAAENVQDAIEEVASEAGVGLLEYVERTSDLNITATTEGGADTVLTADAISVDGSTEISIEFFAYALASPGGAINRGLTIVLYQDGSSIGQWGINFTAANDVQAVPTLIKRYITPSAGSRTYTVRAYVTGGTGVVQAGAGGSGNKMPAYLRISAA